MSRIPKLSTKLDREFRDSYNEGVNLIDQDLNKAVSDSSTALNKAATAETNASLAKTTADTVKAQFDEVTKASTIDPQVSQALIGADGKTYSNIGNRFDTVDALMAQKAPIQSESITYNIPTDFPTLQDAINKLSERKHKQGVFINLNIEAGHKLTSGVKVENGNYSHFKITSTDPIVYLDSTFPNGENIVFGDNAQMPILACLIDSQGRGQSGYVATRYSSGMVERNCGVRNLVGFSELSDQYGVGLLVRESQVYAIESDFSGNRRNLWVTRTGRCFADKSKLTGATGDYGVFCSRSSLLSISDADLSNAAQTALSAYRSVVTAVGSTNFSNAGVHAILAEGSTVNIKERWDLNPNLSNSGRYAIYAVDSSVVGDYAKIENCGEYGIYAINNSRVSIPNATITFNTTATNRASQVGIRAEKNSNVEATGVTITDAGLRGVMCREGSTVNVQDATVTGSDGIDLYVDRGAFINALGCTTTQSTVTGTPNVMDTSASIVGFNNIDGQKGIIWGTNDKKTAKGSRSFSGNGTLTNFSIPHGLSSTPTYWTVQEASQSAGNAGVSYVTADVTNLTVYFKSAPVTGSGNVILKWKAEI